MELKQDVRDLKESGRRRGWKVGLKEGRKIGLKEGIVDGVLEGRRRGREEALERGRLETLRECVLEALESNLGWSVLHDVRRDLDELTDLESLWYLFNQAVVTESLDDFRTVLADRKLYESHSRVNNRISGGGRK